MADRFVETSHEGYFSRVAKSFVGVLIGILLVPGSIAFIGWNEYRTVHRTRGLIEAENVVQHVDDPFEVLPEHNEQLIHLTGQATTTESLSDKDFALQRVALRLAREVEMFQWVETKETRTREKLGGGTETITTYDYNKRWAIDRVASESFRESSGHSNPQPKYKSISQLAQHATVGGYQLLPDQVAQIDAWEDVKVEAESLLGNFAEEDRAHYIVEGNYLHYGPSEPKPSAPQVGDLRIRFRVVEPLTVSVLARQRNEKLAAYNTSNGEVINRVEVGELSSSAMFEMLRRENALLAWILRGVGWVLACVAFGLITGPLSTLASAIPFLGRLTGMATTFVSILLGSSVALLAIGFAWLAVRPILAFGLFALAGVAFFVLFRKRTKRQDPPLAVLA